MLWRKVKERAEIDGLRLDRLIPQHYERYVAHGR